MILIGLDDTDIIDHPGTNQLARHIVYALDGEFHGRMIVRHQLFFDPRVPYTSKNGSASIHLEPRGTMPLAMLINRLRTLITDWSPAGSDPGFCVTEQVPAEITQYARRCQHELITQQEARLLAAEHEIHLEGLGGTEGGVIGALAAVGLAATRESGRIVHLHPVKRDLYEVTGRMPIRELAEYGIEAVVSSDTKKVITRGQIDVGKRLRPNLCDRQIVLYAEPAAEHWSEEDCFRAVKVV